VSNRTEVIVLCEDALHRSFATSFLKRVGLPLRMPPTVLMQGRRNNLLDATPKWIKAVRTRGGGAHLIILVDLDTADLGYIDREIADRIVVSEMPALTPLDNVLVVGAKREVDTWATFLFGKAVDEDEKFPVHDAEGKEGGIALAGHCQARTLPDGPPPSLSAACGSWRAYRVAKGI